MTTLGKVIFGALSLAVMVGVMVAYNRAESQPEVAVVQQVAEVPKPVQPVEVPKAQPEPPKPTIRDLPPIASDVEDGKGS
jgi:hypothetical protein